MTSNDSSGPFDVREFCVGDDEDVLKLLNLAFGQSQTADWFDWKHRRGPWGPSVGWVAEDPEGAVVGARLMVPWAVSIAGEELAAERAMDGAIAPWAQRKGLFSTLVRAEMNALSSPSRDATLVYSTSVPASREAYRKLGWEIWDVPHVAHLSRVTSRATASLQWDDCFPDDEDLMLKDGGTAWTADALNWRIEPASGRDYQVARLSQSEGSNGLILRRAYLKRVPTLVVLLSWGSPRDRQLLLSAAARQLKCPLTLTAGGAEHRSLSRTVGASTVSAWSPDISTASQQPLASILAMTFSELEGAM